MNTNRRLLCSAEMRSLCSKALPSSLPGWLVDIRISCDGSESFRWRDPTHRTRGSGRSVHPPSTGDSVSWERHEFPLPLLAASGCADDEQVGNRMHCCNKQKKHFDNMLPH